MERVLVDDNVDVNHSVVGVLLELVDKILVDAAEREGLVDRDKVLNVELLVDELV